MKFRFHPKARVELNEAVDYYNERRAGLGQQFFVEVEATIQRVLDFPLAWSSLSQNTRRCLTNRFPYGVIYQVKDAEVRIIAIAHQKRRPGYWEDRLET